VQEPELPVGVSRNHTKARFMHCAVVEPAQENQVVQPGRAAVRPMFDVMSIAAARVAARKLALAVIPALQGTAQSARDGARSAPHIQDLAIVTVVQHHDARVAGHAAGSLPAEVEPAHLFNDGQASIQVRVRRRPLVHCTIDCRRLWSRRILGSTAAPCRLVAKQRRVGVTEWQPRRRRNTWLGVPIRTIPVLPRFRGNVRRGACGSGVRLRRHRAARRHSRGSAPALVGSCAGGERVRLHVYCHLETVGRVAGIEAAGQRAFRHYPERIGPPLCNRGLATLRVRRHLFQRRLHRSQQHRSNLRRQPTAQHHHAVFIHLHAQRPARQQHLLGIGLCIAVRPPSPPHQPLHVRGGGA
jgi:hypothetical protein